jgi:hypothetical protein
VTGDIGYNYDDDHEVLLKEKRGARGNPGSTKIRLSAKD